MIIFWNEVIKLTHLMLSSVYFVVPRPSAQPIVLSISPSYVCMKQNTIYRRLLESALIFPICLLFPKVHCHIVVFACNPQVTDLKIQKSTLDVYAKIAKTPFFNTLMQKMLRPLPRSVLKPVAARANSHRILLFALSSFFHSRYLPIFSTSRF